MPIKDLTFLANLKQLTSLSLPECNISDISILENLKTLTHLDVHENPIQDKTAIRKLREQIPNLQILEVYH